MFIYHWKLEINGPLHNSINLTLNYNRQMSYFQLHKISNENVHEQVHISVVIKLFGLMSNFCSLQHPFGNS